MTAKHFVDIIKREKDSILSLYFSEDSETQVGKMIQDITKLATPISNGGLLINRSAVLVLVPPKAGFRNTI